MGQNLRAMSPDDKWIVDSSTGKVVGIQTAGVGTQDFVKGSVDSVTGVINFSKPNGKLSTHGNTHVRVALLGDSITARSSPYGAPPTGISASAIAPWLCANWVVGSPFVVAQNLAVPGDTAKGIMSRVPSVRMDIQCCFVMAGTNDVISMSSSALQATIDSTYTSASGYIGQGVASLVAAGKIVVISTIIPNNAINSAGDSRIQLLDRLNTYIKSLASDGSVYVVDGFSALWDSAQPTLRVAIAGALNADNTHPTSAGGLLFATHSSAKAALKSAYSGCFPDVNIYDGFHQMRLLYNEFRRSTGGTAGTISAGSGTLADGWRCLQNAGAATFTVDATQAYSVSSDYVGAAAAVPAAVDSYWQGFNITSAAANDNPRLRIPGNSDITSSAMTIVEGIYGGSEVFIEMDVDISSPVNLTEVSIGADINFTAGTSPADQPAFGSTYIRTAAGTGTDASSAATAMPSGVRYLLRTPVHRVPENINGTAAITMMPFADMKFGGAGSATVRFGRPRLWHKPTSRAIS